MKLTSLLCLLVLPFTALAQWQVRMNGLSPNFVLQVMAPADSSTVWAAGGPDIYQTTYLGKVWVHVPIPSAHKFPFAMAARTPRSAVYGTAFGKTLRTTDSGAHWTVVYEDSSVTNFINDLVMFDSLRGFAMGDPPDTKKHPGLLTTSDGGATWQVVANDHPLGDYQGRDRTTFVRPELGWTKVWRGGIYKTTNGGATWSQKIFGAPIVWVRWAPGGRLLWAGADTIFMSSDMGESWQKVLNNWERGGCGVFHDATFFSDSMGLVAGDCLVLGLGEGPNSIAARQNDGTPHITLEQNYPNPFNPTTTIRYFVGGVVAPSGASSSGVEGPPANHVKLAIYDVLGREVATLVNERKQAGSHQIELNAAGLATGVYFYRLSVLPTARRDLVPTDGRDGQAGAATVTKKLLLIR